MQHFWVSYPNEGHKLLTGVFIRTVKEKDAISTVIMWHVWCKAGMVCEMYEGGVSPAMSMRTHAMADGIASYILTCQGRCKAAGLTFIFQNSVNSTFYQNLSSKSNVYQWQTFHLSRLLTIDNKVWYTLHVILAYKQTEECKNYCSDPREHT